MLEFDPIKTVAVLGIKANTHGEVVGSVRSGLPSSTLGVLKGKLGVTSEELAHVLVIRQRTLDRRTTGVGRLNHDESDRVWRIANIFALATDVLDSEESAARWLRTPNPALGDAAPLNVLDTEIGVRQVETILGHIKYGDTFV